MGHRIIYCALLDIVLYIVPCGAPTHLHVGIMSVIATLEALSVKATLEV